MRCGECNQRNSVAAGSCAFCGQKFEKKSLPVSLKISIAAAGLGLIVGVGAIASSLMSTFGHSNVPLKAIAQHISAGSKSPEEAQSLKVQLEKTLKEQLLTCGNLPSGELLTKLQSQLPNAVFEVFVFDLPRGMKLVEVDCVLQSTDFLISQDSKKELRVDEVRGLGVYDEGRIITSGEGTTKLILLGHNNIEMKQLPTVKVFEQNAKGKFSDVTAQMVPPVSGHGNAKFIGNLPDIKVEGNLVAASQEEKLFVGSLPAKEVSTTTILRMKDGKYVKDQDLGGKEFSALYAVAQALVSPASLETYKGYLTSDVIDFIQARNFNTIALPPSFSVGSIESGKKRRRSESGHSYLLTSINGSKFAVTLSGGRGGYVASSIRKADAEVANALPEQKSEPNPSEVQSVAVTQPEPTVVQAPVVTPAPVIVEKPKKEPKVEKKEDKVEKPAKSERIKEREELAEAQSSSGQSGVAVHNVSMRTGPKSGRSIGIVRRGDNVKILGKDGSWYRVSVNGQTGYVWSGMIRAGKGSVPQREPEKPVKVAKEKKESKPVKEVKVAKENKETKESKVAKSKAETNKLVMLEKEKEKVAKQKAQPTKSQPDRKTSYVDKRPKTNTSDEPTFVP
ncbi:MAG: SH3 domain-containing protein [Cyanobacteria bacterium TGS_CYA1]|nr:SH3 domain-containing protein [Cyanobacteria bacterium TGS_CYA1]